MTPSAFYFPQLALTGLMAVVGLYNMVRPGGGPFAVFHFADLATGLLGHLVFSLFGSFAAYLGGPVVQVAFPLSLFTYLASLQKPFSPRSPCSGRRTASSACRSTCGTRGR